MAMPQGSGRAFNVANTSTTPSSKTGAFTLPGYIADVMDLIADIGLAGLSVSFPSPVGVIDRVGNMAEGNLIVERAADGALFTIKKSGLIYGPITGVSSWPDPTFEYLQSRTGPTETTGRQNVPLAGLPMGTLPSPAPASGSSSQGNARTIAPNPNVVPVDPIAPPVIPPPEPESSGISLLTIAGLAGALWFAAK